MLSKFESNLDERENKNIDFISYRLAHELNLTSQYQAQKLHESSLDIGILFSLENLENNFSKKWLQITQEPQNQMFIVQINI